MYTTTKEGGVGAGGTVKNIGILALVYVAQEQ